MDKYQLWRDDDLVGEYSTLPEAVDAMVGTDTIEETIRFYDDVDCSTHYLLSTKKGKKMDIATLLRTGNEDAASIARLNAIRLKRTKDVYKAYTFRLSKEGDYSLISYLEGKKPFNEYVKQLIADDLEKKLYPVSAEGNTIFATPAVRKMMKDLDITPYMLVADSFQKVYPEKKYGIIVRKIDDKYYAYHLEEKDREKKPYAPIG